MKPGLFLAGAITALSLGAAAMAQSAAPTPSPAAVEQARRLMATMHMDRLMDQMVEGMKVAMENAATQQASGDEGAHRAELQAAIWEELRPRMSRMMQSIPELYAATFSEHELAEMDRFYSSPVGQSVLEKMPRLMQETVQKTMPPLMADMPDIMARAFNRYCDRIACKPETRAALAKAAANMRHGAPG